MSSSSHSCVVHSHQTILVNRSNANFYHLRRSKQRPGILLKFDMDRVYKWLTSLPPLVTEDSAIIEPSQPPAAGVDSPLQKHYHQNDDSRRQTSTSSYVISDSAQSDSEPDDPAMHIIQEDPNMSNTQREVEDMDIALIFETVPTLVENAQKIFKLLILNSPDDALRNLRVPGSAMSKHFRLYQKAFNASKTAFGTSQYLVPHIVEAATSTPMLTPVLHKANLAALASFISTAAETSDSTFQMMKEVERAFPKRFGDNVNPDNVNLALEIRTQVLILGMAKCQDYERFNPNIFVRHFFLERDSSSNCHGERWIRRHRIKLWPEMEGSEEFEAKAIERVSKIRSTFKMERNEEHRRSGKDIDMNEDVDVEGLSTMFPWKNFVDMMMNYIKVRVEKVESDGHLNQLVTAVKNINRQSSGFDAYPSTDIPLHIQKEMELGILIDMGDASVADTSTTTVAVTAKEYGSFEKASDSHPAEQSSDIKKPAQCLTSEAKLSASEIRIIKDLDVVLKTPPPPGSVPTFRSIIGSTEEDSILEPIDKEDAPPSPMATLNLHKKISRRQPPQGKKQRFCDPQEGATRVSPFDTSDELRETPPNGIRKKRKFLDLQPRPIRPNPFDSDELREPQPDGIRKKRRFIDPQPGATRVSPFDTSDELRETPPDGIRKKHRRIQRQPSNDEELVVDNRPKNSRLTKKSRQNLLGKGKKVSATRDEAAELMQQNASGGSHVVTRARASTAASSSRIAKPSGSGNRPSRNSIEIDAILMEVHPEDRGLARRVNKTAKINRGKQLGGRKKQVRNFWTSAAEELLVEKIGELGCRWSTIRDLREPLFHGRTDVQLKDKARNMKFDFLKAGTPLPANFRDVTISKKQMEQLRQMGIEWEDDGDE
ncbi:hypothetical protein RUND412_002419 [Rhizina undulata]